MAKVIISIPTAKGLMFLLGVNFEKSGNNNERTFI